MQFNKLQRALYNDHVYNPYFIGTRSIYNNNAYNIEFFNEIKVQFIFRLSFDKSICLYFQNECNKLLL